MNSELTERSQVELPLIAQLMGMGWQHTEGDTDVPELTERASFRDVLLKGRLRGGIRRINLDEDGRPWLDERRVDEAVAALERLGALRLMEANQAATELLLKGTKVEGDPVRHQGRDQTVRFVDFGHPERNDFLAINQFRVDPPGNQPFIVPDVVLFVNGVPLVVIECKSPAATEPMQEGITQLLRYSNQRDWVAEQEGVERLFHYNHLMVSTFFYEARCGTVGASYEHYLAWKDTSPLPMAEVAAALGVERLSSQQTLVAGMLRPAHLLDLVRNFTVFEQDGGRTIKKVARYQQFRAVHNALHRLRTGQTRQEHGERDQRGGIIWHTQGSGKSLTMVFLVRKLRTLPDLRRFKVVVVTDRTALEQQLSDTAALTGETVLSARNERHLQELLREESPDLVFAMIQKYQESEVGAEVLALPRREGATERMVAEERPAYDGAGEEDEIKRLVVGTGDYPILNESEAILVLVDEAHRSHGSMLHANLLRALPHSAAIGFTGTPIIMGARTRTHDIFGPFIDRYTIRQSEEDGATVPILYEGRTAPGDVADERSLDQLFEDMFRERTPEELEAIKRKYATTGDVLEAPKLIAAKAADMLRHYVDVVLPNGFKAQVVATSRLAAVRYQQALCEAHATLVEELEALDPSLLALGDEERDRLDERTRFQVRAHPHLDTIKRLEFAAVISGSHNDDPAWREWSDPARQRVRIERFKKPLVHEDPDRQDGLAFVCVQSMLLTGFDAPIEQALYLDRPMQGHELLQAIARVNRTAAGKSHGLVVDYFGVARHLTEALAVYSGDEIEGALVSLKDELPKLEDRHRRVLAVFRDRGIAEITDIHACVDLLRDVRLRAEFTEKLRLFLESLDIVLPRPEGLSFVRDAKILGFINKAAHNRYRDSQLNLVGAGQKVRQLIDEYVVAQGIDPKIPPISITAAEFPALVDTLPTAKAKSSEMEHAARYHISVRMREDPAYYRKLSERLEEILQRFQDNWEELVEALRIYTEDVRQGPPADGTGLDPRTQAPFLRILVEATGQRNVAADGLRDLAEATVEIVEHIRQEIRLTDFWSRANAQAVLRQWIIEFLDEREVLPFQRARAVADEMVQLAKYRHVELAA